MPTPNLSLKRVSVLFCWLSFFTVSIFGEQLTFKHLTTADGLANNRITKIFQDKKGFLWFTTWEGLSRYDGYDFVNYDTRDGLTNQIVNDVAEDKEGRIWAATNDGGISLLIGQKTGDKDFGNSKSEKFVSFLIGNSYYSNKVNRLLIDSKNNLWCLTDDGLYKAAVSDNPIFSLVKANPTPLQDFGSSALFEDNEGNIWFGIYHELYEMRGDEIINHGAIAGYESDFISDAIQDNGRILILSRENGLFEFDPIRAKWQKLSSDLQNVSYFSALVKGNANSVWFGGGGGLLKLANGKTTKYSIEQGLSGDSIISLFRDRNDTLWIGDQLSGINKLSDETIVSYPMPVRTDFYQKELFTKEILQSAEITDEKLLSPVFIAAFKQNKWWIKYSFFSELSLRNSVFQLQNGKEIDVSGFFDKPPKEYTTTTFYDDYANNFLWFSTGDGFVYRMNTNPTEKNSIEKFPCEMLNQNTPPDLMIGDGQAGLWIFKRGLRNIHLRNGRCESLPSDSSIYEFAVRSAFLDSRGWLWIGTRFNGVAVTKNPAAETPDFKIFTVDDGLSSGSIWSIAEDDEKQIYLGTSKGLSRLNPLSFSMQNFTTSDGLTGDLISQLYKDSKGNIWIITANGLSKLTPNLEKPPFSICPTYITKITIAGENLPLPETGFVKPFLTEFAETSPLELASTKNNLTIDFVGLQCKNNKDISYQYILEGIDENRSKPNKNRTITFANLAPGDYRFVVLATDQVGRTGRSAEFAFKILPPIYQRWWFIALVILYGGVVIYVFYRFRLKKLLEVERTRTMIATDLHDDIGSNLSKIAVLSEVVRMQLANENKSDNKLLGSIAEISRESVASMSDIVWAINPKRDSAREMARKMLEHAEEIFVPKDIPVKFTEPENGAKIKLSMNLRRDLYLIYKEAINNITKHSNAASVEIEFFIKKHEIILTVADDGKGFDWRQETTGNGLTNMRMRVEQRLKGVVEIKSDENGGTKIIIRIPQK